MSIGNSLGSMILSLYQADWDTTNTPYRLTHRTEIPQVRKKVCVIHGAKTPYQLQCWLSTKGTQNVWYREKSQLSTIYPVSTVSLLAMSCIDLCILTIFFLSYLFPTPFLNKFCWITLHFGLHAAEYRRHSTEMEGKYYSEISNFDLEAVTSKAEGCLPLLGGAEKYLDCLKSISLWSRSIFEWGLNVEEIE